MITAIIPSRNERFLIQTIQDLLDKAEGEIEVIAHIDEGWPEKIIEDKRVKYIYPKRPRGMRGGINACVQEARGEYLLKSDGHCMFSPGFDKVLVENMEDNWLVIPRRYSLDAENWAIEQNKKPPRDYHYLCYPARDKHHDMGMHGVEWPQRGRERTDPKYDIDENMSFQGSCWFMKKAWFTDFLQGMDEANYGVFAQEPQEIGLKTWLGGGKIMVNKKCWYAHLHKGHRYGRMYSISQSEIVKGHNYAAWYWMNNLWENRVHDIAWLIERFWPVPTWPEDRGMWVSPL